MEKRKTLYSIVVLMLVVVAGWFLFSYQPNKSRLNELNRQLDTASDKVNQARTAQINLNKVRNAYEKKRRNLNEARNRFITRDELSEVTDQMDRMAHRHNLSIEDFAPKLDRYFSDKNDEKVSILPADIIVRGGYLDIGRFIESWDRLPFYITQEGIDIEYESGEPKLKARITVNLYTLNQDPLE